jgi:hypothetical protein
MAPIDDAIAALQGPDPPSITQAAKDYKVNRSTLSRRFRGVTTSKDLATANRSLLSKTQQITLINYINKLCDQGLPPTCAMVRNFVEEIAKRRPGHNWVHRFNKSYSDILSSGYLAGADYQRTQADSWRNYSRYFELVCGPLLY